LRTVIFLLLFFVNFSSFCTVLEKVYFYKANFVYSRAEKKFHLLPNEDDEVLLLKGTIFYLKGESRKALTFFEKIKNKDWKIYLYLGLAYEDLGKEDRALSFYLKTLSLERVSIASYRIAKIFFYNQNYKKAKEYFEKTIDIDSSIRLAYYYLGKCLLHLGDYKNAYYFLSKAVNFYPHCKKIIQDLKYVKNLLGEKFFVQKRKEEEERRREKKMPFPKKIKGPFPQVRIKILEKKEVIFKCGDKFLIITPSQIIGGKKNRFYRLRLEKTGCFLYGEEIQRKVELPLKIKSKAPFYILDVVYGKKKFWHKSIDTIFRGELVVFLSGNRLLLVNQLSLEEYLYGVVPAEIPSLAPSEALKAQAVVARTIVLRRLEKTKDKLFDFDKEIFQVYRGLNAETSSCRNAVDKTRGEVILYRGKPVEAFYHSNCGGCLRSDVFGRRDYLYSEYKDALPKKKLSFSYRDKEIWFKTFPEDVFSSGSKNFRWQRIYDEEDFKLAFGKSIKELEKINILSEGECGYKEKIKIEFKSEKDTVEGELNIRNYFDHLKSSAFLIELKYKNSHPHLLILWGAGFGHGAGLSQEGAMRMADLGYPYKEILNHYYKNIKIEKIY